MANVNRPPAITSSPPTAGPEGQSLAFTVAASDPDPGDILSFALDSGPTGAVLNAATGAVSWTPADADVGRTAFSISVADPEGASDRQVFFVEVQNVNSAPYFEPLGSVPDAAAGRPYRLRLRASDPDDDPLTFSLVSGPTGMVFGGSGEVNWTPAEAAAHTSVSVTVRVSDGSLSGTLSFVLQVVGGLPRPPVLSPVGEQTVAEDTSLSLQLTATDPNPGEALVFELIQGPRRGIYDPVARRYTIVDAMEVAGSGALTFSPGQDEVGTHVVEVRVTDPRGLSDQERFSVVVTPVPDAPEFVSTPVTTTPALQPFRYRARAVDEDQDPLRYRIVHGPEGLRIDADGGDLSWIPSTAEAGPHAVTLEVSDGMLTDQQAFVLTVTSTAVDCSLNPSAAPCQALAWSYALARDGTPLGGASVTQTGPTSRTLAADLDSGRIGLGGDEGSYVWQVETPGFASVYAQATLTAGRVRWVPVPKMAPLTDMVGAVPANEAVDFHTPSGRIRLAVPAQNAGGSPVPFVAAELDGQTLPGWLPLGWSVVGGLHFEVDAALASAPVVTVAFPAPLPAGTARLLAAVWNETSLEWRALESVTVTDTSTEAAFGLGLGSGAYVLVLPDTDPAAPAWPLLNAELAAAVTSTVGLTAAWAGTVDPTTQVASLDPARVAGMAEVTVDDLVRLPSATVEPAELEESYLFPDGRQTTPPLATLAVGVYQYPPVTAPAAQLSFPRWARFPVRPRFLYGPTELTVAAQRVRLPVRVDEGAVPVGVVGGVVTDGQVVVTVPPTALGGNQLVQVEQTDPAAATAGGQAASSAFRLSLTGGDANQGLGVAFARTYPAGSCHVLAREQVDQGLVGWQPVERFCADALGQLASDEGSFAVGLSGVSTSGHFALFEVPASRPVVAGTVVDASTSLVSGARVDVLETPWSARSDGAGAFRLLAGPDAVEVVALAPSDGRSGQASGTVSAPTSAVTGLSVVLSDPTLSVARVDPADGPDPIRALARFDVFLTAGAAPASTSSTTLTLTHEGAGIAGQFTLRNEGRLLRFTPDQPLPADASLLLSVDTSLESTSGLTWTGPSQFSYVTAPVIAPAVGTARLLAYAPGSTASPCHGYDPALVPADFDPTGDSNPVPGFDPTNPRLTCLVGTPGTAEPGSSVILVNPAGGRTGTTLAYANGSFKGFVEGEEEDRLEAVLRNLNGTSVMVRLQEQRFDDGSVALFEGGGVVRGVGPNPYGPAPVELVVEPNALPSRGKFRVRALSLADIEAETGELTPPEDGEIAMGVIVDYDGPEMREPLDVRFPFDASGLSSSIPLAERDFLLVEKQEVDIDGELIPAYNVLDNLHYEDGTLATHSYPYLGALMQWTRRSVWVTITSRYPPPVTGRMIFCPASNADCQLGNYLGVMAELISGPVGSAPDEEPARLLPRGVVSARLVTGSVPSSPVLPGALVSTTDGNGRFTLPLPPQFSLLGRHPDFPGQPADGTQIRSFQNPDLGVTESSLAAIAFTQSSADFAGSPPTLSLAQRPAYPQVFAGPPADAPADAVAVLTVRAVADRAQAVTSVGCTAPSSGWRPTSTGTSMSVMLTEVESLRQEGSGTRDAVYHLVASAAGTVELRCEATAGEATAVRTYTIAIGSAPPVISGPLEANPGGDTTAPYVMWPEPRQPERPHRHPNPLEPFRLQFSEPVNRTTVQGALWVNGTAHNNWNLSPDGRWLSIFLETNLSAEGGGDPTVSIQVRTGLTDLQGNPLDQNPLDGTNSVTNYDTAVRIPGLSSEDHDADAVVFHGGYVFSGRLSSRYITVEPASGVLGVAASQSVALLGFGIQDSDSGTDEDPSRTLPGVRDLLIVPNFDYAMYLRNDQACPAPGRADPIPFTVEPGVQARTCIRRNRTLLVAVGAGPAPYQSQSLAQLRGTGARITVYDVTGPPQTFEKIASAEVALDPNAIIPNIMWDPPNIAYMEFANDYNYVGAFNLQSFILVDNLEQVDLNRLPNTVDNPEDDRVSDVVGVAGLDLNDDGDYLDPNERVPLPAHPTSGLFPLGYPGKVFQARPRSFDGRFRRFTFDSDDLFTGVVYTEQVVGYYETIGIGRRFNGVDNPDVYRIQVPQVSGDDPIRFDAITHAKGLRLRVRTSTESHLASGGRDETVDLVVIAGAEPNAPSSRIYLLDVRDGRPRYLEPVAGIVVDGGQPGIGLVRHIRATPSGLELEGFYGRARLDYDRLTMGNPSQGSHPALAGAVSGAGAYSRGGDPSNYGLRFNDQEQRIEFSGPELRIVRFPEQSELLMASRSPVADADTRLGTEIAAEVLASSLARAILVGPQVFGSDLEGIDGSTGQDNVGKHYYALVKAPGGFGESLRLQVDTLDVAGEPIVASAAPTAPVRAMSTQTRTALGLGTASVGVAEALTAYRVSSDLGHPDYNTYLAGPFAVMGERVSPEDVVQLETNGRRVFHSAYGLRISVDPTAGEAAQPLLRFINQASASSRSIEYGVTAEARTLPIYVHPGPNPEPAVGSPPVPGSQGLVGSLNGELSWGSSELSLPSGRLPLSFDFGYRSQILHDGALGLGFTHAYDQRLVEVPIGSVGGEHPVVIRVSEPNSRTVRERDLIFHDGGGSVRVYRRAGSTPPPGIQGDPLRIELGWDGDVVDAYFVPEPGVFDFVVKFTDGMFARLTADGTRYFYLPDGRLERIEHRYDDPSTCTGASPSDCHRQVLLYAGGRLRRVRDDTYPNAQRHLDFGYFAVDPQLLGASSAGGGGALVREDRLDSAIPAGNGRGVLRGRLARVVDPVRRSVEFEYDAQGRLRHLHGVDRSVAELGGFTGRPRTEFAWNQNASAINRITPPGRPPLLTINSFVEGEDRLWRPTELVSPEGTATINYDHGVRAAELGSARTEVTLRFGAGPPPDPPVPGSNGSTEVSFDAFGAATSVEQASGSDRSLSRDVTSSYLYGRVLVTSGVDGGAGTSYTYDRAGQPLRSRGIPSAMVRRGGQYAADVTYDMADLNPRFNLPLGTHTDFDGVSLRYESTDGRNVTSIFRDGIRETFRYGSRGELERHVTPEGVVSTTEYLDGLVTQNTVGGVVTTHVYTAGEGDLGIEGLMGWPTSIETEGQPDIVELAYNAEGAVIRSTRGTQVDRTGIAADGQVSVTDSTAGTDTPLRRSYTYSTDGFLQSMELEETDPDTEAPTTLQWRYDRGPAGSVTRMTSPDQAVVQHEVDHLGRVVARTAEGVTVATRLDANGYPYEIEQGGEGRVDRPRYDNFGRLRTNVSTDGKSTTVTYNGLTRLARSEINSSDGLSLVSRAGDFDGLGRPRDVSVGPSAMTLTHPVEDNREARVEGDGVDSIPRASTKPGGWSPGSCPISARRRTTRPTRAFALNASTAWTEG